MIKTRSPKSYLLLLIAVVALLAGQCCDQGMQLNSLVDHSTTNEMTHDMDMGLDEAKGEAHACCPDKDNSKNQFEPPCSDCEPEWIMAQNMPDKPNSVLVWFFVELKFLGQQHSSYIPRLKSASLNYLSDRNLLLCRFLI
ncbi:hypothetical protein [Pleionea sediminis]|uniref:hypothetical protein n=1 Tax=Pleionea sediminis TaxID=2569479 RepID=UPI0011872481|nr:hypothetical protein [Pleionea sediminis]